MRCAGPWAALALLCSGCTSPLRIPFERPTDLQALFLTGYRSPHSTAADDHPTVAVELATTEPGTSGWGYEVGARYGSTGDDATHLSPEYTFTELDVGVRQCYPGSHQRPFFGLGLAWMHSEGKQSVPDFPGGEGVPDAPDDSGLGIYGHGGMLWSPGVDEFGRGTGPVLGFDVRGVLGDDTSYFEVALVVGYGK